MANTGNAVRGMRGAGIESLLMRWKEYSYFLLAAFLILVIGVILVPVHPLVLSVLISVNLLIGVLILMTAISIQEATKLAAFPSLLLFTTLYRVALNMATTKLVLAKGDAGEVVAAFGTFVSAGEPAVGAILFIILIVFQFVVITKGAERVAEVGARFTLDAMPQKQMGIDGDVRMGAITQEEGRQRKVSLERESKLYGAMDGAMKFVKGDAIFGLLLILVNILGGVAMGILKRHMEPMKALEAYGTLTIGDGLVSILPSILISIGAGVVATRVASEDPEGHLGKDIGTQLLAHPRAIASSAVLFALLGLIPGLPKAPFFLIAALAGGIAYALYQAQKKVTAAADVKKQEDEARETGLSLAVPILVEVSESLTRVIDRAEDGGKELQRLVPELRDSIYYELGVLVPPLRIRGSIPGEEGSFTILLKEVPVSRGKIPPGKVLVNESAENLSLFQIDAEEARNPATNSPACWIPEDKKDIPLKAGLTVFTPAEALVLHVAGVLKRYTHEFIGLQEAQAFLDHVSQQYPKLVEEVVPKVVSLYQLTEVLQRLVREGISIRDMKGVLEALSEWGRVESDALQLTELVRSSLARQICFKHARSDGRLIVYQVDPEIQQTVSESIRHTSTGKYISLAPDIQQEILLAIRRQLANRPPTASPAVVLTEPEVRPYLRRLVELEFPDAAVISMRELAAEVMPQPIGVISLNGR